MRSRSRCDSVLSQGSQKSRSAKSGARSRNASTDSKNLLLKGVIKQRANPRLCELERERLSNLSELAALQQLSRAGRRAGSSMAAFSPNSSTNRKSSKNSS